MMLLFIGKNEPRTCGCFFPDVQRAQIRWRYHAFETVSQIARALKMTRKSVLKWIDKTLQIGAKVGMKDTPRIPRSPARTPVSIIWTSLSAIR